jgi:hypothetical protein
MKESLAKRLFELLPLLTAIENRERIKKDMGEVNKQVFMFKEKNKYVNIDICPVGYGNGSGCWMIDKETGDVFNIKGYGQVDKKKNLGNIFTIDPEFLYSKRWNYLR